jgi:hypothetical protein
MERHQTTRSSQRPRRKASEVNVKADIETSAAALSTSTHLSWLSTATRSSKTIDCGFDGHHPYNPLDFLNLCNIDHF